MSQLARSSATIAFSSQVPRSERIGTAKRRGDLTPIRNLFRAGILIGILAVLVSIITGLVAYELSRRAHVEAVVSYNRVLSEQLAQTTELLDAHRPPGEKATAILQRWQQWPRSDPSVFVCVIDANGRLIAHSIRPENVGKDVSGVPIPGEDASVQSVEDLLKLRRDWAGENNNFRRDRQAAAYTWSPSLNGMVVVHTPAASYEADVRRATIPWIIGFFGATLILWPACLVMTQGAYRQASNSAADARKLLADQYRELELLYRTTPVGLCLLDRDLRILKVNQNFADSFGGGCSATAGHPPKPDSVKLEAGIVASCRQVVKTGQPLLNVETTVDRAEGGGDLQYYCGSYHPVADENDEVVGVAAVIQEVTQDRIAEQARFEQQLQLAHMARRTTMGEMAAGLAHEIAQPLAVISNYASASLIEISNCNDATPESVTAFLEEIREQTLRCGEIIRQMRDFVTRDTGTRTLLKIDHLVTESIALIHADRRFRDRNVNVTVSPPDVRVIANRIQLQQVLINLLINALESVEEAAPPEPDVSVCVTCDTCVQIVVADNGSGFNELNSVEVFAPYVTTKPNGLGMGLAICRAIIEAHDGRIAAHHGSPQGAEFHIYLPVCES